MKLESQITNNHSSLIDNQSKRHSFNYNIFPDTLFMQNKANFRNDKMNITLDMTSKYEILSAGSGQKTKPIQTQLKPIQSQFNPIQSQLKPKQIQFAERAKNDTKCVFTGE